MSRCSDAPPPVTLAGDDVPTEGFNHGNGSIGVALQSKARWSSATADGSVWAEIAPDGSITARLGCFRAVERRLSVRGKRLDGSAPPLPADVPDVYGTEWLPAVRADVRDGRRLKGDPQSGRAPSVRGARRQAALAPRKRR